MPPSAGVSWHNASVRTGHSLYNIGVEYCVTLGSSISSYWPVSVHHWVIELQLIYMIYLQYLINFEV